ncbi:hypothetical protein [Demequina lignilytica]|uniref:Protein ImuA n=1 Tax=Demequina lignilytica TaxID=3051663 RepID=A0AB35MKQ8_9MICO|nr:hypothetical protein [Demequina sp. SYSU T0a273]MDN4484358.1 hypothetical protein [Demequina sp. SYSU T0a273]
METAEDRLARARAALEGVQRRVGTTRDRWSAPTLPLAAMLDQLLPEGLRRGRVVAVEGSTALLLSLVAAASAAGSWTAVVGMPSLGVVAAARRGLDLDRLASVPHPGAQAPAVAGACVDGMDVVVLGPRLALSDADRRRLASRARERGAVILSAGPWPGAHVSLAVTGSRWHGLGAGDGRLRGRDLMVEVRGRQSGGTRLVTLPFDADAPARRPAQMPAVRVLGGAA